MHVLPWLTPLTLTIKSPYLKTIVDPTDTEVKVLKTEFWFPSIHTTINVLTSLFQVMLAPLDIKNITPTVLEYCFCNLSDFVKVAAGYFKFLI